MTQYQEFIRKLKSTKRKKRKIENNREELRNIFLIPSDTKKEAKIKSSDSEEDILEKIYAADSKLIARKDNILHSIGLSYQKG
jgi:ABC-type tungstate transport system permease subunit